MIDFRLKRSGREIPRDDAKRSKVLLAFMSLCAFALVGRAVYLQVVSKEFLEKQGDMRHIDVLMTPAYRGMIVDRNGEPLAVSAPVDTVTVNPRLLKQVDIRELAKKELELRKQWHVKKLDERQKQEAVAFCRKEKMAAIAEMEKILGLPPGKVSAWVNQEKPKGFAYVARQIPPSEAAKVRELRLAGVDIVREFKRFYPSSEVSAHLVGFTDQQDKGQEGLEAIYEPSLKGIPGKKTVLKDGSGNVIADLKTIQEPVNGKTLQLSIDQHLQYLAYRELQQAITEHQAKSGVLVMLDAKNGEILAVANQPSFNPNNRAELIEGLYRNRAFTEVYEPGSTVKPFVVAAGLEGGYVKPNDAFYTRGVFPVGGHVVRDVHNYGTMDLTHVIKKSSNIAVAQMSLRMPPKYLWDFYTNLGFGAFANVGFPHEAKGSILNHRRWRDFDRAVVAFGYGFNASALQLARAYTALADDGILHSVSLLKRDKDPGAKRVLSAKTAKRVRAMMETVISKDGTAYQAKVDGYSVAGKTGTVKKSAGRGGYADKKYFSVFAGIAPAKNPRLVMVVIIDEPSAGKYYGGLVSAPVFSKVMAGALRAMDIPPDQEDTMPILLTRKAP